MSGFELVPLDDSDRAGGDWVLDPIEPEKPSVLRNVALNNPVTAIGETALNLGTMGVALPIAGLAGIATEAGRAMGLTKKTGAGVVHDVAGAMTYQPRGEMGQAATQALMYPFEKLAEAGQGAGEWVLEKTGSPLAATTVDTAINAAPMAVVPALKVSRSAAARGLLEHHQNPSPEVLQRLLRMPEDQAVATYEAWQAGKAGESNGAMAVQSNTAGVARHDSPLHGESSQVVSDLRGPRDTGMPAMAEQLRDLREGRGSEALAGQDDLVGAAERQWELRTGERGLGEAAAPDRAPEALPQDSIRRGSLDDPRVQPDIPDPRPQVALSDAGNGPDVTGGHKPGVQARELGGARRDGIDASGVGEGSWNHSQELANENRGGRPATVHAGTEARAEAIESITRAERILNERGSIAGWIDHYNRHVRDGNTVESFSSHPDGSHTLRVTNGQAARNVTIPADKLPEYLAALRDPAKVAEIESRNTSDVVLGKRVRDLDNAALERMRSMVSLSDTARAKLEREAGRREVTKRVKETVPLAMRVDEPVSKAAVSAKVSTETPVQTAPLEIPLPKIAGKAITEFDDAALAHIANSPAYGETAKVKAQAEIQRRTASADFSAESPEVMNSWALGANYVPLVDQYRPAVSKAASVADLPAPKRREHIISEFASAIGTTVYEGRIKGDKTLGYFRPKIEEVRTKRANDLEVAGHEVAHLIDFRVPELKKAWSTDKTLAAELKSVSYDQKNVREGWAEGMRLWLTQPETLEAKAPRVHAFIEDFANGHQYGPALRKAQEQMTGWFGQDALNRARSKIGTETPLREYMDRFWDKFRQATVDDLHGIYQMERSMLGKIAANGPYESARTSRAAASIADGAVRFGYPVKNPDGSFKFAGKGLEEILQPVSKSIDDALLYFVGRSANELMGQGREHLFTKGEIDAMLKLKTPERAKAFEEYQAWNKGVLDFAEAQGVINPESRALWQRTQYLPFHRVEQPGGIKGKPGDWAGIQQLTGGTTNIKDVLGNMIGNAAMLIDRSVKNEARRKVAKLAQMEGGGKFMVKIEPGEKQVKIAGDAVIEAILKKMGIPLNGDAPAFFEFLVHGQPPAGTNVVAVLQGGKPIWFEVGDPILYRALKAIDRPLMNQVTKVIGWPKRIGQASITTTPEFWLANIARDTLMGSVMSRAGFRPVIDSLKGMASRMTSDPAYKDFIANGGGLSSIFLDETHLKTKLEKYYRDQGIDYRTVLDTPDKILTMVETLGDAFEMSTRLGEYKRATAAGENPRHAAYLGREVSTDFAMRGDSKALGFMYDTVMFLKPAVVSWDRLYRGLAHDPNKGAIAAKAGMMAMFSAGLYLLNRNDPRYADLPDWDRDANWHFFIGGQHFRYPKIWEIGALASGAERTVEKIIAADPQGLGKDFARILGATFNLNLMPQILAPLYEQGANRNSFTKSPIETPGMEGVQPFLRAKPGTSETMKAAGMATKDNPEWAQVNPVRAEALLRGYFNTWAMYGLMLTDQALYGDQLPEKRTDELPVVRRFYANEPAKHTKYESEFYDLLSEAKRLRGTMRELDDMGLREVADAKEQSPLAGEAKPLERAAKNLGVINNEMQAVRRDGNLTPKEKRAKLDELTIERNALLKGAVQGSKAAQKAVTSYGINPGDK